MIVTAIRDELKTLLDKIDADNGKDFQIEESPNLPGAVNQLGSFLEDFSITIKIAKYTSLPASVNYEIWDGSSGFNAKTLEMALQMVRDAHQTNDGVTGAQALLNSAVPCPF